MEKSKLQFGNELVKILDIYTENTFSSGEPLDSDEVENLCKILKPQLELLNGNITEKEYNEVLEPSTEKKATNKVYVVSVNNVGGSDVTNYALLLANDVFVNKVTELTEIAKKSDIEVVSDDLDLTSNFFMLVRDLPFTELRAKVDDAIGLGKEEFDSDWIECFETQITPAEFKEMQSDKVNYNWNDDSKLVVTNGGFYLIEQTETNFYETSMIDLVEIIE